MVQIEYKTWGARHLPGYLCQYLIYNPNYQIYTLNKKKSALFYNTVGLTCFSDAADGTKEIVQENWLVLLFRELEKQGITLPER